MADVTYILAIIFMIGVVIVLARGLRVMLRGGDGKLSNRLMQMRVFLQFIAVLLIVITLWLSR